MDTEVPNRRLSTAVTLVVLVALLVIGGLVGLKSLFAPLPGDDDTRSPAACTPTKVGSNKRIKSSEVTVSVFNAGDRSGLAGETLDALEQRGFVAGEAGNAPASAKVRAVQVWTTEKPDRAARLVAQQFGPGTAVRRAENLGPGIDVIVGSDFKGLVDAPRSIKAGAEQEVCVG